MVWESLLESSECSYLDLEVPPVPAGEQRRHEREVGPDGGQGPVEAHGLRGAPVGGARGAGVLPAAAAPRPFADGGRHFALAVRLFYDLKYATVQTWSGQATHNCKIASIDFKLGILW